MFLFRLCKCEKFIVMECFSYRSKNAVIPTPNFAALAKTTLFKKKELIDLFKRYEVICNQSTGKLDIEELSKINEFMFCPILPFVKDKELDYDSYIELLNVFTSRASTAEKLHFLISTFSESKSATPSRTGSVYLKKSEVMNMMRVLLGGMLNDSKLNNVIETMWESVAGKEERISHNEFFKLVSFFDLHAVMTVDLI